MNHGSAGFFAYVLFVVNQLIYAEEHGLTPFVFFGKCTVHDTRAAHPWRGAANLFYAPARDEPNNMWEYYFEPVSSVRLDDARLAQRSCQLRSREMWYLHHNSSASVFAYAYGIHASKAARFDGEWFDANRRRAHAVIARHVRVLPHISAQVDAFWRRLPRGPVIGLHVRGTDKKTGGPIVRPAAYVPYVEAFLKLRPAASVFLATDSAPFIDVLRERFGARLSSVQRMILSIVINQS